MNYFADGLKVKYKIKILLVLEVLSQPISHKDM